MSQDTDRKEAEARLRQLEKDVAIIETNQRQFADLFDRFDITIERIGDVSQSIKELLVVHEQRIDQAEKSLGKVIEILELRREDARQEIEMLKQVLKDEHDKMRADIAEREKKLNEANDAQDEKINKLMKIYYAVTGTVGLLITIITFWDKISKIFV